jgi:hypothetical protein
MRGSKRCHVDVIRQPNAGDQTLGCIRSAEFGHPESAQQLFDLWGSINRKVLAWGYPSWHFDILDILVSLIKHLLLISIRDSSSS